MTDTFLRVMHTNLSCSALVLVWEVRPVELGRSRGARCGSEFDAPIRLQDLMKTNDAVLLR